MVANCSMQCQGSGEIRLRFAYENRRDVIDWVQRIVVTNYKLMKTKILERWKLTKTCTSVAEIMLTFNFG